MRLIIENKSGYLNDYYFQTLCLLYYPGEKFPKNDSGEINSAFFYLDKKENENGIHWLAKVKLSAGEKSSEAFFTTENYKLVIECGDEFFATLALGKAFLQAGRELFGFSLPWGYITGLRPVKRAKNYLEKGYDDKTVVLQDMSFSVQQGEAVTFIGRTGAGKSTLFKLILGLYAPQKGQVLINGIDAAQISDKQKRKLFGYVEQTFHSVAGTVAEQISLFDDSIGQKQIEEAAKLVGLHENIMELDQRYNTPVEKLTFSQGQFQLLSIARAVASQPKILLLDEITANLDSETELRVLQGLERACKGRTVLSISHRLNESTHSSRLIQIGE